MMDQIMPRRLQQHTKTFGKKLTQEYKRLLGPIRTLL